MDIASDIAQNKRELASLKAAQVSSLANIDKFVMSTTYTATGRGSGVFGKAGRILFVFLNTSHAVQPLAIMNVRIVSDDRAEIAGENSGFYKTLLNEQMVSQSVGQVGWRITTPWIAYDINTSATLQLEIQIISNISGEIQVIDGGYRYL